MLYFSDIFADKPVPDEINTHPLLLGECLGGSVSYDEFEAVMDLGLGQPNTGFAHIAIEVPGESGSTEWCDPVSDEEYDKL